MLAAPINGISALNVSANYGQSVNPVRPAKKVEFSDAMVVAVRGAEEKESQAPVMAAKKASGVDSSKIEAAFNSIAGSMQGQNNFYDSAMQGGSYAVVGSMFDAFA